MKYLGWCLCLILSAEICYTSTFENHVNFLDLDNNLPRVVPVPVPTYLIKVQQPSPVDAMIDISNSFAARILLSHAFLNRNNFAFSPSELTGVLTALYEATDGDSSRQIAQGLMLPLNTETTRIGYRDIFRKLKTYLFKTDHPLQSLSFNKSNITIQSEYEGILKFYGFDLAADMTSPSLFLPRNETTADSETLEETSMTSVTTSPSSTTTELDLRSSTPEIGNATETVEFTEIEKDIEKIPSSDANVSDSIIKSNELKSSDKLLAPATSYLPPPPSPPPPVRESKKNLRRSLTKSSKARRRRSKRFYHDSDFYFDLIQPPSPPEVKHYLPFPFVYSAADYHHLHFPINDNANRATHTGGHTTDYFILPQNQVIRVNFNTFTSMSPFRYFTHLGLAALECDINATETTLMILLPDPGIDPMTAAESILKIDSLRKIRSQLKPTWVQARIPDFQLYGSMSLTNDLQNLGIYDIFEPHRADFSPMSGEKGGVYVRHIEQSINISISSPAARKSDSKNEYNVPPTPPTIEPIIFNVNRQFFFFVIDKGLQIATMAGRILNPLNVRIH